MAKASTATDPGKSKELLCRIYATTPLPVAPVIDEEYIDGAKHFNLMFRPEKWPVKGFVPQVTKGGSVRSVFDPSEKDLMIPMSDLMPIGRLPGATAYTCLIGYKYGVLLYDGNTPLPADSQPQPGKASLDVIDAARRALGKAPIQKREFKTSGVPKPFNDGQTQNALVDAIRSLANAQAGGNPAPSVQAPKPLTPEEQRIVDFTQEMAAAKTDGEKESVLVKYGYLDPADDPEVPATSDPAKAGTNNQ